MNLVVEIVELDKEYQFENIWKTCPMVLYYMSADFIDILRNSLGI